MRDHFEYFEALDAQLLADEAILEEEKKWLEHDMSDEQIALEGFARVFDK